MTRFMISAKKGIRLFHLFSVFAILILPGCNKLENTTLGAELLPGTDQLNTDTMLIPVSTISFIEQDTTVTGKREQHLIGYFNDPMFGTTTGAAYFQTVPFSYPFQFQVSKDSLFLDSVVLSLSFSGTYGDTNAVSRISVYRITDPNFKPDRRYKVNEAPDFFTSDFLGAKSFTAAEIRKGYKLAYKTDSAFNQLRIRLSDALGRSILDENNVTGAFRNDTTFKAFLNGFALIPDSTISGNAMHYFSLADPNTRLNVYYRILKPTGGTDTLVANFPFVPELIRSANANKIHRNFSGGSAEPVLTSGLPSSLSYILTAPGTAVRIQTPAFDTLVGKKYIVHRAEIVARQLYEGPLVLENLYTSPVLHLYAIDSEGKNAPLPYDSLNYWTPASFDFFRNVSLYTINTRYLGGFPSYVKDPSSNTVSEYKLNITRYVQNVINGNTQRKDLKLTAPYYTEFRNGVSSVTGINPLAYGRVKLGGGLHSQHPMFVRIYYSKQ